MSLRLARSAWRLLRIDAARAISSADKALALAQARGDVLAQAWAQLARGYHLQYFGTLTEAAQALQAAQAHFDALGDRAGHILAVAGQARILWRGGEFRAAVDTVLPLRDEGLRVLKHEQRGMLLNTIAGCYSAAGDSQQAFAYMYEALRDASPTRGHGFDAVLHANLSHELMQLGDFEQALRHVAQGITRSAGTHNPFLRSVLLINRVVCLTELGRAAEALPDVAEVLALPTDPSGRGANAKHFETLAIAALAAGDLVLGEQLVAQALQPPAASLPDERLELAVARTMLAQQQGRLDEAAQRLAEDRALAEDDAVIGLSLRVRCRFFDCSAGLQQARGEPGPALADLRRWQRLHQQQSLHASRARYQAAALQTELLRLQHTLAEREAQGRATERARAELAEANAQLSRRIDEVQALQEALRQQATRDALTTLHNRRHLNDTLPAMFALARREQQPLAVVLIDLDHFKSVNDRFGHDVGDELLMAFGRLLAESVRGSDVACRYGGEEFCLLLPHTSAGVAHRKVSQLLQRWRQQSFDLDGLTLQGLSFSAGVTDSSGPADTPDALLKAADQALLAAKQLGRSRVLAAGQANSA
ncbi:diguanylate cyclase [Aquabacterium sp.]|uniref:diguanylate cyclase n=1 Tax=Aquabacterium sp. TaxID=1872578 RepID=UPI002C96E688|nr:diguanylate cyclase [Aquabacterium sp.]HSW07599.1 diguanylate cyclase [Aquabacterium sp.]